ncbi:MAG TPA: hypothetical protein VJ860_04025 [Polyangia bacterium]|jgi:hypothetical protein|nr:hypothetical protein [Polyangia bacterium]
MESTSHQQSPPPCQCQQQLVGALPLLALAFAIIVGLDRWNARRRKNKEEKAIAAAGGATNGDKT